MKVRDPKVDKTLNDSFVPSKYATALAEGAERIYSLLGKPTDCSTDSGWKMCDELVEMWYKHYPWELDAWKEELKDELDIERSVKDSVKGGGYFPISYPTRLYQMLETYLPDQRLHDRGFIRKMVRRHPVFKRTNFKI